MNAPSAITPAWSALSWAGSVLLALGVVALGVIYLRSPELATTLSAYEQRLERDLRYLQLPSSARALARGHACLIVALLAASAALGTWLALALPLAALVVPKRYRDRACRARTARIESQLDTWLVVLSNALRATPSLGDAIDASAARVAAPLCDELRLMLNETRLGMPLDRALDELGARVDSPTLRASLLTLRLARSAGGELSATLENAAASLREMLRLEGVIRTKTAEGRAQSLLIALIPAPLVGLLDSISPELLRPLWSTSRGHAIVACAFLLWLSAIALARKITAVEI
jgi:tight adherence protein B